MLTVPEPLGKHCLTAQHSKIVGDLQHHYRRTFLRFSFTYPGVEMSAGYAMLTFTLLP
jgi:hypothetical protein